MVGHPDLVPLLQPRSIAVVGASADPDRIGGVPLRLLGAAGYGPVYAVNPKYDRIGDTPCYPGIEAIPEPVDLAILATPAREAMAQLEAAHRKGARAAVVFASGFAETGLPDDVALQARMVRFAAETGMVVAGPNCLGVVNWTGGVFATFARAFSPDVPSGSIALIGQSGNIASAIYRLLRRGDMGLSHAINTGNEACLDLSAYLAHMVDDPATDTVICYVEELRDGPGFVTAARALRARDKLLAVCKSGTSEKGAEAARSHTASLSGNRAAYDAAFRAAGVAVAEDLTHLVDLAAMHRQGRRRPGRRVGIVSVSGAAGALLSDGLSVRGMEIPTLPAEVQAELKAIIPAFGMVANPVDVTANIINTATFAAAVIRAVAAAECVDVLLLYVGGRSLERTLPYIAEVAAATDKRVVVVDTFESGLRREVEALGLAYFEDLTRAVRAIGSYVAWSEGPAAAAGATPAVPHPDAAAMLDALAARGITSPSETEAKALLALFGVPVVQDVVVTDAEAAAKAAEGIGYPVVLKLVSPDVPHKTEVGGVCLNLGDAAAVRGAFADVMARAARAVPHARIEGATIEPQIRDARELLVGVRRDPVFGPVMTAGMGGVWTELLGDVGHALLPVDEAAAEAMLRALKTFPLLDGFRGAPRADLAAACRTMAALSAAVLSLGEEVLECEINPLLVLPQGQGAVAADALLTLGPCVTDPATG
ncbi:acetate--CoA ligase family protein [Muricoccus radiodurans]|uniref:acetate--CoA ligase family protein n=1 Tax=Muricoccus radiodurans TaxID=2231721 RepID=UPI003CF22B17